MMQTKDLSIPEYTLVCGDIMRITTIKIHAETKAELDRFREYKNESYDEVILKVIGVCKNIKKHPELSEETIKAIEAARARFKKGQGISEEEMWKRLGM